jgi:hypothetical protein
VLRSVQLDHTGLYKGVRTLHGGSDLMRRTGMLRIREGVGSIVYQSRSGGYF